MTGFERDESGAAPAGGRTGRGDGADGVGGLDEEQRSGSPLAPLVAGVVMIGFGVVMLTQTLAIRGEGFDPGGPRFMPLVVTLGWLGLSTAYLAQHLVRLARAQGGLPAQRFDHAGQVLVLLVLLVAYAYAIDPVGYVVSTAAFFVGAARVLGSHVLARDITVAVALSVGVFLVFTRLLNIYLPPGVLPL